MIEQATIITGTPEKAEKQLREFLASHPNAAVLSSAVTTSQELEPIESDKGGKAKPGKAKTSTTVCLVVGIKL